MTRVTFKFKSLKFKIIYKNLSRVCALESTRVCLSDDVDGVNLPQALAAGSRDAPAVHQHQRRDGEQRGKAEVQVEHIRLLTLGV